MKSIFIPLWIQPSTIPRDEQRNQRFENIAYFGNEIELAEEFKTEAWSNVLKSKGFNWVTATTLDKWSDYSNVDAVVAIRKCHARSHEFNFKPASKLYNSWHAGIPAILGVESAYLAERRSELDYKEANSPEEVINALECLRDDPEVRKEMVRNGKIRAEETKPAVLAEKWEDFLINVATPAYQWWCSSEWTRRKYFLMHPLRKCFSRIKRRVFKRPDYSQGY